MVGVLIGLGIRMNFRGYLTPPWISPFGVSFSFGSDRIQNLNFGSTHQSNDVA